ncbi:MAG TPA: hypothetical protein VJ506_02040 [Candidatus Limnocylindrales bacterium]|nr:hypothetical protein [Candidatus Limnocylindrales bacterium]
MQAQTIRTIWRIVTERRSLLVSVVVLGWSIDYTVTLAVVHNTGAELYGVLTAAISTGAAIANLVLLRSPRSHRLATAAVVVLWTVVLLGGLAGTVAHVVGPAAGHGPVDLRPRPITAPLVFTLLGSIGAAALVLGQRMRIRSAIQSEKE